MSAVCRQLSAASILAAGVFLFSALLMAAPSLQRVFLRILVVRTPARAEAALQELQAGQPFAAVAGRFSIDRTAARGGYLGEVRLENLNSEYRRAAQALEAGTFSPVFRSGRDYVILYRLPRHFRSEAYRLKEEGDRLLREKKIEQAIQAYQQAVEIYPDFIHGHFGLGVAYDEAGHTAKEKQSYRAALDIAPDFEQARYNLGKALMSEGDLAGAMQAFQQALEHKPDILEAHVNLSALYLARGNREAAIEAARKAIETNPLMASGYYNLGLALGLQEAGKALENFEMAASLDPSRYDARLNAAISLAHLGETGEAVKRLQKMVAERPDLAAAQEALARLTSDVPPGRPVIPTDSSGQASGLAEQGRTALLQGKFEEAVAAYEEALRLQPGSKELQNQLAWSLVALGKEQQNRGRWDAAISSWERALAVDSGFVPALEALAEAFTIKGDFARADGYLQRARRAEPQNPRVILLQSRLAYERRDLEEAFAALQGLDIERLDPAAALKLVEQLFYLELDSQASTLLNRLQLEPHETFEAAHILIKFSKFEEAERRLKSLPSSGAQLLLGRVYASQLRFEEAEAQFSKLISENPEHWPALYFLGQMLIDAGRAARAVEVLGQAHRLQPDNVNILYKLGEACRQEGRLEEALHWLRQGLKLEPESFQLNFQMGQVRMDRGEWEEAKYHFLKVLEQEPDHIRTHYLLGRLYQRQGESALAQSYLQKFQALSQRLEEGRQRLRQKKEALQGRTLIS